MTPPRTRAATSIVSFMPTSAYCFFTSSEFHYKRAGGQTQRNIRKTTNGNFRRMNIVDVIAFHWSKETELLIPITIP